MLNTDTNREACLTRHYRITASLASQFPTCCWFAAPKIREGRRDLDEPIARAIDDPLETLLRNRSSNGIFVSVVNELRGEEDELFKRVSFTTSSGNYTHWYLISSSRYRHNRAVAAFLIWHQFSNFGKRWHCSATPTGRFWSGTSLWYFNTRFRVPGNAARLAAHSLRPQTCTQRSRHAVGTLNGHLDILSPFQRYISTAAVAAMPLFSNTFYTLTRYMDVPILHHAHLSLGCHSFSTPELAFRETRSGFRLVAHSLRFLAPPNVFTAYANRDGYPLHFFVTFYTSLWSASHILERYIDFPPSLSSCEDIYHSPYTLHPFLTDVWMSWPSSHIPRLRIDFPPSPPPCHSFQNTFYTTYDHFRYSDTSSTSRDCREPYLVLPTSICDSAIQSNTMFQHPGITM